MSSTSDMEKQPLLEAQREPEHEPTLSELQQDVRKAQRAYMRAWSRSTSGKLHRWIMISVTLILTLIVILCMGLMVEDTLDDDDEGRYFDGRIPLEAHIMSKCPDAKDCLHDMILPAMQNISHKVDFKLSYIGTNTDDDDGVICMHGPEECLGNIIELCAAQLYPDPKTYLGFVMCMTREYDDIPRRTLVEDCVLEHSMSMEDLNNCTNQDDGSLSVDMLRASFNRTAEAGVTKSCTVRLNGQTRCIRDGGEWKDCDGGSTAQDLVADILDQAYSGWSEVAA
ncbi:hypothetical protein LTR37_003308 [Vermiconidia calcicola]|uniref:Uncharacterized protein n=1 Tax=Vermiconidia calcicola TaxID=1690605 RepID=A0ACC3NQA5_9PEZI|nr:hypothetical protein LTR37_003308 [Vermiconidia calcicola]